MKRACEIIKRRANVITVSFRVVVNVCDDSGAAQLVVPILEGISNGEHVKRYVEEKLATPELGKEYTEFALMRFGIEIEDDLVLSRILNHGDQVHLLPRNQEKTIVRVETNCDLAMKRNDENKMQAGKNQAEHHAMEREADGNAIVARKTLVLRHHPSDQMKPNGLESTPVRSIGFMAEIVQNQNRSEMPKRPRSSSSRTRPIKPFMSKPTRSKPFSARKYRPKQID